MKKYAIIVAGGIGTRMGSDIPKQFLLLKGKPVLMHTIEAFYNYDPLIDIILVLPAEQYAYWLELCDTHRFEIPHRVVYGGETRFHSVQHALELIDVYSLVAVHDGVRPLVSRDIIASAYIAAEKGKVVCPVVPVTDSLRIKVRTGSKRVDRNDYYQVQTPQVFSSKILILAYQQAYSEDFTDDISVVEIHRKCQPMLIEGSPENIKITTPVDLAAAEVLLNLKCRI